MDSRNDLHTEIQSLVMALYIFFFGSALHLNAEYFEDCAFWGFLAGIAFAVIWAIRLVEKSK